MLHDVICVEDSVFESWSNLGTDCGVEIVVEDDVAEEPEGSGVNVGESAGTC